MHKTIGLLVYGKNEEEAKENAENLIDDITGEGKYYDYGGIIESNEAIFDVESEKGKDTIKEFMDYTREDVFDALKEIRKAIENFSDEDIFEEEILNPKQQIINGLKEKAENPLSMIRHYFYKIGDYDGACIWLYDYQGAGIRTTRNLKWALEHYDNEELKKQKLFIVLCDVHF